MPASVSIEVSERSGGARRPTRRIRRQIPADIANNAELDSAVEAALPSNYNFEIKKTLWRLREVDAKRVALQLPEGLLMYANALGELIRQFHNRDCVVAVLGDVTYGACCVDDLAAKALGCDFLVHYGHSCLVPSSVTGPLKSLYVFVEIAFDVDHLRACVCEQFGPDESLALAGTIQFATGVARAQELLATDLRIVIPQQLPLSGGEVLGCTAPRLEPGSVDAIVFVADGRFHLESIMIRNPTIPAFRYDPYAKRLTRERYDHSRMVSLRDAAVATAADAHSVGVVLGTLGRQGSPQILDRIKSLLRSSGKRFFVLLASEVSDATLAPFKDKVDAWIQIACPRLSIDWGHTYAAGLPILSPYEAFVAFDPGHLARTTAQISLQGDRHYPMDFYAKDGGPWSNYYKGS